jgi:hypothetical protein
MKLMTALLALLYCATAFAMGEIKDGHGVGFGDTRAKACDAAQSEAFSQGSGPNQIPPAHVAAQREQQNR